MSAIAASLVEFAYLSLEQNLFSEIALVHGSLKDYLVDALKFGEGELFGQQFITHGSPFNLVPQTPDGVIEYLAMIEGEARRFEDRMPSCIGGI